MQRFTTNAHCSIGCFAVVAYQCVYPSQYAHNSKLLWAEQAAVLYYSRLAFKKYSVQTVSDRITSPSYYAAGVFTTIQVHAMTVS
jgi:hypothetical protein